MQNSTRLSDVKRMYQNINWAIRKNLQGKQTDLTGDYLNEMETLDDHQTWENIESFYASLLSDKGWEHTHNVYRVTVDQYPSITKYLTICVYS